MVGGDVRGSYTAPFNPAILSSILQSFVSPRPQTHLISPVLLCNIHSIHPALNLLLLLLFQSGPGYITSDCSGLRLPVCSCASTTTAEMSKITPQSPPLEENNGNWKDQWHKI